MDPHAFRRDLDQVPAGLAELARRAEAGELTWPVSATPRRLLVTGMGSSWFAALAVAQRLRAAGLDAVAELASAEHTWPPSPELVVVAISATGSSTETLAMVERHLGTSQVVSLTNTPGSPLAERSDAVVLMHAGDEAGGVACRSYRHTIALLLALEAQLVGGLDLATTLRRASAASAYLLDRADGWLPEVLGRARGADGLWFLAPAERWCSALQGALMVREGPRRLADGCETGDWSHVDVYLTKTLDYRAVVFTGSRYDHAAADWMTQRHATSVAVGGPFPGASVEVRYPHDDDPLVALLTEVLVAELIAASWWAEAPGG